MTDGDGKIFILNSSITKKESKEKETKQEDKTFSLVRKMFCKKIRFIQERLPFLTDPLPLYNQ